MKKQFFCLFLFSLFISCSDNVTFNNPAFEGQKDNVFWRAVNAKATLVKGIITIEGLTRNEKLTLNMPSPKSFVDQKDKKTHITYVLGTTNQTIMSSYVLMVGTPNSSTYQTLITPGPVNKVLISAAGLGYTNTIASTTGGTGTGLRMNIGVTPLGGINSLSVNFPGSGYTAGDVITVSGGNGNAKFIVQNVTTSNGEIVITGYDGIGKILSGTFKFNSKNINNSLLVGSNVNFQYGNFYIPLK